MRSKGAFEHAAVVVASVCLFIASADVAPAGDPPAQPKSAKAELAEAIERFPADLAALADWCDRAGLAVQRNRVAESVLLFSPDDASARAWLGFKSEGEGKWKRVPTPPPLDRNKDALAEWTVRRDALAAPFRGSLMTMPFGWNERTAGPRYRVIRALVSLLPDDREFRAMNGETYAGGRWILNETAATPAGRRRIADLAHDARTAAAKSSADWTREPDWMSVLQMAGFTVRSALPKSDTDEMARAIVGARGLLTSVLATKAEPPPDLVVFVFADYHSHKRFLENRSDLDEERRKELVNTTAYWIGHGVLVSRDDPQTVRVDGIVRQTISALKTGCGRMYRAADWMGEGVGMYLTHALVGTRLTVFVQNTEYSDQAVGRELADPRSDWVALARRMVERGFDPKIPVLVGTPLNSLTKDDGLFAYALAAYFLESRPADAARLVARTQGGTHFHKALAEVCAMDAEGLEYRFLRWLRETK